MLFNASGNINILSRHLVGELIILAGSILNGFFRDGVLMNWILEVKKVSLDSQKWLKYLNFRPTDNTVVFFTAAEVFSYFVANTT